MKISYKILSTVFAAAIAFSSAVIPSSAKTMAEIEAEIEAYENRLDQLAGQKDKTEAYLDALRQQSNALDKQTALIEGDMAPVRERINQLSGEIAECDKKIKNLESEIARVDKEIAAQNEKIQKTYEVLKKRLKAIYMAGETSELEIFLGAEDFQDFLTRTEFIRQISKRDNALVDSLRKEIKAMEKNAEALKKSKEELTESKTKIDMDKAESETKMQQLQIDKAKLDNVISANESNIRKQNQLMESLDKNSALTEEALRKAEQEKAAFSAQLDKEDEGSSSGSGAVNNGTVSHNFRVSSKGVISPLQDGDVKYTATFAQHSARGTASVDLGCMANRVVNGKTYYTSKTAKIYAPFTGTVTKSTYRGPYGNYVEIDSGDGLSCLCAHMDSRYVQVGQKVVQGQVIGTVGNSGNCYPRPTASNPVAGSHLHFEMRLNRNRVNPEIYLPSPLI